MIAAFSFASLESNLRKAFFPLSSFSRSFLDTYEDYLRVGWARVCQCGHADLPA